MERTNYEKEYLLNTCIVCIWLRFLTLYLAPTATMIQRIINLGMIDRRDRGLQRPWGSEGRHALLRNEPEQLRGGATPHPQGRAIAELTALTP